jgi:hypothetical protein
MTKNTNDIMMIILLSILKMIMRLSIKMIIWGDTTKGAKLYPSTCNEQNNQCSFNT